MASEDEARPLKKMAEAFKELANILNAAYPDGEEARIELGPFSLACSLVSPLFRCLGIAFKFAELDYIAKQNYSRTVAGYGIHTAKTSRLRVENLSEASKSISTLPVMMAGDIQANCVRIAGSHTRNLLRVKRGIDMVKVLFEQIIVTEGNSLKDPASKAYAQVFAPYHGWVIRKAVAAGMYALPTKVQLLKKLNEDETSASIQMQSYVASVTPVISYIDQLFISRELGIDW